MRYWLKTDMIFLFLLFVGPAAFAVNCWSYNTSSTCTTVSGCIWQGDSWGSWCTELSCWSLYNQSACQNTAVPGKNCTWTSGAAYGWCETPSCWSFSGSNQSACVNNTANLKCNFISECTGWGSCWGLGETACGNMTGCSWGSCSQAGCWSFNTSSGCAAATGSNSKVCKWNSGSNYCYEAGCWENTNRTGCESAGCKWNNNYCSEIWCYNFDYTNSSTCVNNTANLSCTWNSPYCQEQGCWNYNTQSACTTGKNCMWKTYSSSGWCEEINCWKWDSMGGGNKSICEANSTRYGLGCNWQDRPGGTAGVDGWCYKNFTATTTCTNLTTERSCIDSFYCFWDYGEQRCKDPSNYNFNNTVFSEWNPGCYIFDANSSSCGNITGCNWTGSVCATLNTTVLTSGLSCPNINDSILCNNMAVLSTCCTWEAGACKKNQFSTACFDQIAQPPEGAGFCEDYNAYTSESLCGQIANNPWYMPCKWDNNTQRCKFNSGDVFNSTSDSLVFIDNKKACESAGGKWISENYCQGNVSVPAGRCEYKFDEETNCDRACYACEHKSDGGHHNSTTSAKTACLGSKLGFCEFKEDPSAPNGYGYCNAKTAIASGREGTCDTDCDACTFYGDSKAAEAGKKPSYYCANSKASCKWVADPQYPTDESKGVCVTKDTQTCADSCDRCATQDSCVNMGRSAQNITGGCSWNSAQSICTKTGQTSEVCWDGTDNDGNGLIDCADSGCFTDSVCGFVSGSCLGYMTNTTCVSNGCEWVTDAYGSWCDFKGSSCWKYDGNETACKAAIQVTNEVLNITTARLPGNDINQSIKFNLTNRGSGWVNTSVIIMNVTGATITSGNYTVNFTTQEINFLNTSYMIGYNRNTTNITYRYYPVNQSCQWYAGSGSGFCEQDWSLTEQCATLSNRTNCEVNADCRWTNDTWCQGAGNGTGWCNTKSGWCDHKDFVPKQCWYYDGNQTQCSGTSGCSWTSASYQYCSVDYSGNCWQYGTQGPCESNSCYWQTSGSSSWCTNPFDACPSLSSQSSCEANSRCAWNQWNYCEAKCYKQNHTSSTCSAVTGCRWVGGWCNEQFSGSTCSNSTNWNNASSCNADSKCDWKEPGWCDPAGFAGGAVSGAAGFSGSGVTCYKYDANQTGCNSQTGCGWVDEPMPYCSIDYSADCWQNVDSSSCLANNCYWKNDVTAPGGGWCQNLADQCWANSSLNTEAACNANSGCYWLPFGLCESKCFNQTLNSTQCGDVTGCKWVNGWCNVGTVTTHFKNMSTGEPVPLGFDVAGDASPASVDIIGFGMKDMGQAFGFGVKVIDFINSSICNNEKMPNGATGAGSETNGLYVYFDTDGSTSGGCALAHNLSASGYEFRFKYGSVWNATAQKAVESTDTSKCDSGTWKAADIKASSWKKIMCSDIGGIMIAVEKSDLNKFSLLYNTSADMRVYVATTNVTTNASAPSDTAGPGWTTPGSVDFEIQDLFKYGADTAKFEGILKKGFVQYEDCFNNKDDDVDGLIDCNDYECEFAAVCSGKGVNVASYQDTRAPQVTGVKLEEYTDSALISYDTNKPANGTLEFYYNDSRCSALNTTIYDIGIRSASVRDYKVWHIAELYEDGGAASLKYNLTNATTYYFKLKVCDSEGKCAVSKCSSFQTSSPTRCAYCNFVTRINVPSGWTITYDVDQNNVYEHVQGQVCGPNAGMKTNYVEARRVNINLYGNDNKTGFWFINSTLTRSALNDKVRTVNDSSGFKNGTTTGSGGSTIGYVGLVSEVRDKIINNLHPEACRIKIQGTGTCSALWHCADNLSNCVDRSSESVLIETASTYCIWQLPYCEFSTWAGGQPSSGSPGTTTTTTSGGGGGGGGNVTNATTEKESKLFSTLANVGKLLEYTRTTTGITEIELRTTAAKSSIVLTVNAGSRPAGASEPATGVYGYIEITKTVIEDSDLSLLKIRFKVPRAWVSSNGIDPLKVALYRYTGGWNKLATAQTLDDGTYY